MLAPAGRVVWVFFTGGSCVGVLTVLYWGSCMVFLCIGSRMAAGAGAQEAPVIYTREINIGMAVELCLWWGYGASAETRDIGSNSCGFLF